MSRQNAGAATCRVAVIGAGWAGLSTAIHLQAGANAAGRRLDITLLDAAPQAGGRARGLRLDWDGAPIDVDNGQHLIVGAYRELLQTLDTLRVDLHTAVDRRPLTLTSADGFSLCRSDAPWARRLGRVSQLLALLGARGLSLRARAALLFTLAMLRLNGFRAPPGVDTVQQWWTMSAQHPELIARLWRPVAIGTLNTDPEHACAATFLNVLRDTLGGQPEDGDFLLPRGTLDALFVDPALAWLQAQGVHWLPRSPVDGLQAGAAPARWQLRLRGGTSLACDALVLALPPLNAARLLAEVPGAPASLVAELRRFEHRAISTAWCGWRAATIARPLPAVQVLLDDPPNGRFGQWLFGRGLQHGWQVAGVVVSDSARAMHEGPEALAEKLRVQLSAELDLPAPERIDIVSDRRATFACTPGRPRLTVNACQPDLPALWLAGDHLWPEYPATLESALRAGHAAADAVLRSEALQRPEGPPGPRPRNGDQPQAASMA